MPVTCPHCSRSFKGDRINARHKRSCAGWETPPPPPPCLCGHKATSSTQMKRHRKTCEAWQTRDKKAVRNQRRTATNLERYGVEDASQMPEVRARRAATNLAKYGAVNPFCKEASTFDKVQASLEGKRPVLRGADNPFAKPEVKAKIRDHWMQEHGVENPQQVAEIRAKTRETNIERYGGELLGSPVLEAKARETNLARYGDAYPQRTDAVKDKQRETNLERWGVPWTGMHPEIRAKQLETHHERYGSHWFASDEGKAEIKRVLQERYGVDHWMQTDGAWDRLVESFREKYGVDHPLQLAEFLDKQRATNVERYGTIFPGLRNRGMNGLESAVFGMVPEGSLVFTGDGAWWRHLPRYGRNKNPDFIVPGPDPTNPKKGVTRVVEAFGDFWHSRMFTGKAPFAHEQDLIEAYAEIGITCLVLWESEVKSDPDSVRSRLEGFLTNGSCS